MLRQPKTVAAAKTAENATNTILLSKKIFSIPSQNVRDAIVDIVRNQMPGTAFAGPFITHISKMGKKVLDQYDDLELVLGEHHVTLRFQCPGRTNGEAMRYTIDRLDSDPNEAFQAKSWTDKLKFW